MAVNPDRVLKAIAAIEAGDAKTVRMMLKAGVPANHFVAGTFETDQRSLAHCAAASGQFEIFELLIAAGADIDAYQVFSWRPPMSMLQCACSAQLPSLEIIQKILREGQLTKEHLNQSLMLACYGSVAIVDELLRAGADPNFVSADLDTPLIVALWSDSEDVAIHLVEAGAATDGFIKNKDRDSLWKKSIVEAVRIKGMDRLLALLSGPGEQAIAREKPKRVRKPKTIEECWKTIDEWLARKTTDASLPSPFDFSALAPQHILLQTSACQQVRMSLQCHNGSGDIAIVDVPDDASYSLLSVEAAVEVRDMLREVMERERTSTSSDWWSEYWWPFADNGGGDLLIVDCREAKTAGQVLKFSHETRQVTRFKKSVLDLLQSVAVDIEWQNSH